MTNGAINLRAELDRAADLENAGDLDAAAAALIPLVDCADPEIAPQARYRLARVRENQGDLATATTMYRALLDDASLDTAPPDDGSGAIRDAVARAAYRLGCLRERAGEAAEAQRLWQVSQAAAVDVVRILALGKLGDLHHDRGETAEATLRIAIASGDPELAPNAAVLLGRSMAAQHKQGAAIEAWQLAIDSGNAGWAADARFRSAEIFQQWGAFRRARAALQATVDSGREVGPAAFNLGLLELAVGDLAAAKRAFQAAVASGHPEWSPKAAVNLGNLLERSGDTVGARAMYQTAVAAGLPSTSPMPGSRLA